MLYQDRGRRPARRLVGADLDDLLARRAVRRLGRQFRFDDLLAVVNYLALVFLALVLGDLLLVVRLFLVIWLDLLLAIGLRLLLVVLALAVFGLLQATVAFLGVHLGLGVAVLARGRKIVFAAAQQDDPIGPGILAAQRGHPETERFIHLLAFDQGLVGVGVGGERLRRRFAEGDRFAALDQAVHALLGGRRHEDRLD